MTAFRYCVPEDAAATVPAEPGFGVEVPVVSDSGVVAVYPPVEKLTELRANVAPVELLVIRILVEPEVLLAV